MSIKRKEGGRDENGGGEDAS